MYSLTVTTWEYYHGIKIVFFRSTNQVRTAITNSMKWSEPHCFTPLSDFGSANLVRTTKIHILRFGSANQVRQKFGSGVIVLSRGHSQRVENKYVACWKCVFRSVPFQNGGCALRQPCGVVFFFSCRQLRSTSASGRLGRATELGSSWRCVYRDRGERPFKAERSC